MTVGLRAHDLQDWSRNCSFRRVTVHWFVQVPQSNVLIYIYYMIPADWNWIYPKRNEKDSFIHSHSHFSKFIEIIQFDSDVNVFGHFLSRKSHNTINYRRKLVLVPIILLMTHSKWHLWLITSAVALNYVCPATSIANRSQHRAKSRC